MTTKFDDTRIQKMGVARSRDGGRDLVAYTREVPGMASEKFIFQCKLIRQGVSLTKSKMSDASNVIFEYRAKGYGVFTSAVIDPTLHDMLDRFQDNQGIDTSIRWSIYEIERFLAKNNFLKRRYFGDTTKHAKNS